MDDSLALVAVYNKMNGENWTKQDSWLTDTPANDWWGITVTDNRVKEIDFHIDVNSFQNVNGTFPKEFWQLTALTAFDLRSNNIEDSISSNIKNLKNLKEIKLSHNQITGSLPKEMGDLNNLTHIISYDNQIEGTTPKKLGNLTNLKLLRLSNNQFKKLPALSPLEKLNYLHLENNLLTFGEL